MKLSDAVGVTADPCPFDTEPCESCGQRGRAFEGAWYHLTLVLHGLGHHDAPVFAPHTVEDCRAYRRGLAAMEASLGFPRDVS